MPLPGKRSRGACGPCRARKRKCDETRPGCKACAIRGINCPGYSLQLKWGVGIASRGRLTGAERPFELDVDQQREEPHHDSDLAEQTTLNQQERIDISDDHETNDPLNFEHMTPWSEGEATEVDPDTSSLLQRPSLVALGVDRFQQFVDSGHYVLFSAKTDQSPLREALPQLTNGNDALFAVCVALQLLMTDGECEAFFAYYQAALSRFQIALNEIHGTLNASTLLASCLLCTICIYQGIPWTKHLYSLHRLLQYLQDFENVDMLDSDLTIHLLEVMGIMDLPTFTIGRQTPVLGIWDNLRLILHRNGRTSRSGVEPVSGLPRSLIDILARMNEMETEVDLWLWPGEIGEYLQIQLWEAYRLAGMLRHRQIRGALVSEQSSPSLTRADIMLPSSKTLLNRALACLSAILLGLQTGSEPELLVDNSLAYCVMALASESELLAQQPEWCYTLDRVIETYVVSDSSKNSESLRSLLRLARTSNGNFDIDAAANKVTGEAVLF